MSDGSITSERLMDKYGLTMTTEQVAEVLGLAKDTVLRILQRKEIVARKRGNKWIIAQMDHSNGNGCAIFDFRRARERKTLQVEGGAEVDCLADSH